MKLIAHRGNINGSIQSQENQTAYIKGALNQGFDAEIDVWLIGEELKSGHDKPEHELALGFLKQHADNLWIHCKNLAALEYLSEHKELNYFYHENDRYTLTSKGHIWAYPGQAVNKNCVLVVKEMWDEIPPECLGVCCDFVGSLKKT